MVYLVGAGPGNPGLITYKGIELIKSCDVLIYDRLGTGELLDLVKPDCVKIYVGKKAGAHYRKQDEINEILTSMGKKYDMVVRLKGGDSFVFGRGGEEVLALRENDIPYQLVPGVTSAIAVPELMGIPVTHREVARSFNVFTGHTKDEGENALSHIHHTDGTSVILMGLGKLPEIVKKLLSEGTDENTSVSVISNGTLPGEKRVTGSLLDICDRVKEAHLESPAIIVIGETAKYNFRTENLGVLQGKQFGVVGTRPLRQKLRASLEKKGASLFSVCNMEVIPENGDILDRELNNLKEYSWIGFTSQNGIRVFFDAVKRNGIDYRAFAHIKFAVVGSGTMTALSDMGFHADFVPDEYTTESMALGLAKVMNSGEKLLIARAKEGSERMLEILADNNIDVNIVPIYSVTGSRTEYFDDIYSMDALIFASASGVRAFAGALIEEGAMETFKNDGKQRPLIGAIGKVTADELMKYGISCDVVPGQCDSSHLIEAFIEKWEAD